MLFISEIFSTTKQLVLVVGDKSVIVRRVGKEFLLISEGVESVNVRPEVLSSLLGSTFDDWIER